MTAWHGVCSPPSVRFNITIIDPPGYPFTHFLFDVIRLLQGGLESLGHPCTITRNALEAGRINILVGLHNVQDPDLVKDALSSDRQIVLLQTEMVTGRAFNQASTDERFDKVFLPVARRAIAVWDSSTDNLAALRAMGIEAEMLRFGFDPALSEIRHKPERDVDFFFYGSLTPHRKAILGKLDAIGYRVRWLFDAPPIYRNDWISRSEIVLSMRQSEAMSHLPHGRILYLVSNRCLVVGESGREQEPLEDVFVWSDPEEFIELCRETRARTDRRALADEMHERFRARPMSGYLAPLVASLEAKL
jgi:hypothetical protein